MSKFTDYGENRMCDMLRGQALSLPAAWRIAPLSAATDAVQTEVVGSGISRFPIDRSLLAWAGTQGAGSTSVSSGTSKSTSNNVEIDMGTAPSALGTVTHVGLYDDGGGGADHCWAYAELATPIVTAAATPLVIAPGVLALSLGLGGGSTTYLVNKLLDLLFRGQAYTYPASVWLAAYVAGGVEVGGGLGYARAELVGTLASLSGTQGAGSTSASSGVTGRTSNNSAIAFDDPTGDWGGIDRLGVFDASTSGNELWRKALAETKSIGVGLPLSFAADKLGFTWA